MNFSNTNKSLKDVMKRAEEEDVMVYAIGLAGENGPVAHGSSGGSFGHGGLGRGGFGRGRAGSGGPHGHGGRPPVDGQPDAGLPKIAAATGGGYFELASTNDLASTFGRVADELHHQYASASPDGARR